MSHHDVGIVHLMHLFAGSNAWTQLFDNGSAWRLAIAGKAVVVTIVMWCLEVHAVLLLDKDIPA